MPVALISTSTSPAFGSSSCTWVIASGLPASNATAARTSMVSLPCFRHDLRPGWKRRSSARLLHHQLGLRHDRGELAVAAGDAGLPDRGGAAAMQRRAFGLGDVALRDRRKEIGLTL